MKRTASFIIMAAAALAGAATAAPPPADFNGIWWIAQREQALVPLGGGAIPFTAQGRKSFDESAAALKAEAGKPVDRNDLRQCLPLGPTRILQEPFPLQIVQHGNDFILLWEHNHAYESVYFDKRPDPDADWAYMGNSIGAWARDGITITTTGFNDQTLLDNSGLPHSEELRVTRKLRLIEGGKALEIVSTITDPVMFTKPWSVRHVLQARPDATIEEYVCGQGPTLETRYTRAEQGAKVAGDSGATRPSTGQKLERTP